MGEVARLSVKIGVEEAVQHFGAPVVDTPKIDLWTTERQSPNRPTMLVL